MMIYRDATHRDADNGDVVPRELVAELAQATRSRRVRSQKRKRAEAETRCNTPTLRPSAIRERGSELRESKQIDALIDVGL
jgi:hypothetical protein